MDEQELCDRESCISNFLSIMPEYVKAVSVCSHQCDVKIIRKDGTKFRYGYFDGWTFRRENPVCRVLHEHGISVNEGGVDFLSEPQYDMVISFVWNGRYAEIANVSDNRTQYEVDYNFEAYVSITERVRELLRFRQKDTLEKTVEEMAALLNFFETAKIIAQKALNREKAHLRIERTFRFDDTKFYTFCVDGEQFEFESGDICPNCGEKLKEV